MTVSQSDKAARFRALHEAPGAFVIPNPWDAGSARILAALGFPALATSSGAEAGTLGRRDGKVTRDEALAHAARSWRRPICRCRPISRRASATRRPTAAETIRLAAGGRPGRRLDRGRHRRQGHARSTTSAQATERVAAAVAGGARAAVSVHADGAHRELPARQPEPGRRDPAAAGLREGRRRRADGAGAARPRRGARGVLRGVEAGQLHGRHQGQVVHGRRAAKRGRAAHQPGDLALPRWR